MNSQELAVEKPKGFLYFIAVFLIYLIISSVKVWLTQTTTPYDSKNETAYYWSEAAFQYRYAKMVGEGREIPALDVAAEFPEGVVTGRELTLLMERTTGTIYKLVSSYHKTSFHIFLIYFYSLLSSLSVFAFYFAALQVNKSPPQALLVTLVYAFTPASWGRFIGDYVYEGFALPFLFGSFALFLAALRAPDLKPKQLWIFSGLAGAALCVGLTSWHFARFYWLIFMSGVVFHYFSNFENNSRLIKILFGMTLCCIFTGLLSPVLKSNAFLTSPAMLLAYSLLISHCIASKSPASRWRSAIALTMTLFLILIITRLFFGDDAPAYGHVYSIFIEKISHFLQKPGNPSELGMQARILWVEAFNSPLPGHFFYNHFPVIVPILIFWIWGIFERPDLSASYTNSGFTTFFFLSFLFLYLLIERLAGFYIFFLCLYLLHQAGKPWRRRALMTGLLMLTAGVEVGKTLLATSEYNFVAGIAQFLGYERQQALDRHQHSMDTINWIKAHTEPRDVLLAGAGYEPLILAYADRAIVLQPKFEALRTREKYISFLSALYDSEEAFFNFCIKYKVNYFIYQNFFVLNDGKDGARYAADALTLKPSAAAYLLHFLPQSLKHFKLVFQNTGFRVYRVIRPGDEIPASTFIPYVEPVYDLNEFTGGTSARPLKPGDCARVIDKLRLTKIYLLQAVGLAKGGKFVLAETALNKALGVFPTDAGVWSSMGELKFDMNDQSGAEAAFKRAVDLNPNLITAQQYLAQLYMNSGRSDLALPLLRRVAALEPLDAAAQSNLGIIYFKRKEWKKSLDCFARAHQLDSEDVEISKYYQMALDRVR